MNGHAASVAASPERTLAFGYAPLAARRGLVALFDLDDKLAAIVRAAREPLVGQMRLTWWHEALSTLDRSAPPAEPVLTAVASDILRCGVNGRQLAGMIDGWEILLGDEALTDDDLATYAGERGGRLFAVAAQVCGAAASDPAASAGEGWALMDLATHVRDPALAKRARDLADERLASATSVRWSRRGRGLGALALIARSGGNPDPGLLVRLIFHRMTGR
ncbi:squalene/phytoene synthase family protein [Sphingomonas sp. BT553]|uniref:Squalene/phytoene synthase family protein n=2 Tax=Sphingomonas mollis TaxID=2795726 RepID=A0ABS0XM48_9SPHN|nr:squalene/phytoene synthase family protein [Sphingomonas sp. BT553]